jgi:hypothetical protein
MSSAEAVALVVAAVIAAVHVVAPRLWADRLDARSPVLSIAGGVSVAFVFVHLLPELSTTQAEVEDTQGLLPYLERHVYLLALLGMVVFYGLRSASRRRRADGRDGSGLAALWASLAVFGTYNAVIGYLLVEQASAGMAATVYFGVAMGLHLLVIDEALDEQHRGAYGSSGRYVLAGSVVAGWVVGMVTHVSQVTLGLAIAFLAGGIILNVLKQELPAEREGRFGYFAAGAAAYTLLLLVA